MNDPGDKLRTARELADRGDLERAIATLADETTPVALVARADLASRHGDVVQALAFVERALAVDIDAPGARERHDRYRADLGLAAPPPLDAAPTLARPSRPVTPYRILREAGRGGAATVYEAFDDSLGRPLALKLYHRPSADRARLVAEARTAVMLAGPGVVRVFDADPDKGLIALEWAALGAASDVRRREPGALLPLERWLAPLLRVLARIHAAGWVHGDLKLENVLLREPAEPVLTDFGSARRAGEPMIGGTPGYVSPERTAAVAASATPDDDVFAFGVLVDRVMAGGDDQGTSPFWANLAATARRPRGERPADAGALCKELENPKKLRAST